MAQSNTVILGAGIIGLSTAFYLSESTETPASSIHLVENSTELFSSASGFAGGFLAADWFGAATAPVGALSFQLHRELADRHDGQTKWGYSRSSGFSFASGSDRKTRSEREWMLHGSSRSEGAAVHEFWGDHGGPAWLAKNTGDNMDVISKGETTAQVEPRRLCEFLLNTVLQRGVQLHQPARAISVSKDMRDELASVRIATETGEEMDLPCSRLLIAAGVWSPKVFSTLFASSMAEIPIAPLAGHSIVLRSPRWTKAQESGGCHAVFASDIDGFSPELISRIGGEIYVAGLNDPAMIPPERADLCKSDAASAARLRSVSNKLLGPSEAPDDLEVVREGLCFRPITTKGPPIISRLPDHMLGGISTRGGGNGGVFLAAGHGPWGISQSLGTGKVMSELIEGRQPSADIRMLDVTRFLDE